MDKLKRDSLSNFASSLSFQQVSVVKDLFKMCDVDKDGQISLEELGKVMSGLGVTHTRRELEQMFTLLDVDGSKTISFPEFLNGLKSISGSVSLTSSSDKIGANRSGSLTNFLMDLKEDQVDQMTSLFQMVDKDGDGAITKRELYNMMKELGLDPSKDEFNELFRNLDQNGDGTIELKEFIGGMRWLNKGLKMTASGVPAAKPAPSPAKVAAQRASVDEADGDAVARLKETNRILTNYIKDLVGRGMTIAENNYRDEKYETTKAVLQTLDLETLTEMEVFIGTLTTEKQRDHNLKMTRRIAKLNL